MENTGIRVHGIIENAKSTNKRGGKSFQIRRPSQTVIERVQAKGLIVEDVKGYPDRVTIKFDPELEMFKEVPDTP